MPIAEEIQKLQELKENGSLTEEEFQRAKESLLPKNQTVGETIGRTFDDISSDVNTWGMFIHLSQFCGYLIPLAGLIVPIVLWQIKKGDSEVIDRHGRIVANWIISELIYGAIGFLLCMIVIGVPLLFILGVIAIAFPVIGGIKAKSGEVWPYPLSIPFFEVDRR